MTRDEFQMIWHDWLRGVTLIVGVLFLVALYFAKAFSQPAYTLMVVTVFLLGGFGMAASVCLSGRPPVAVRVLAPLVAVAGALLFYVGVRQAIEPGEPVASTRLSALEPSASLEVPTEGLGECYLHVRGRPGASPTGKDNEVKAEVVLESAGVKERVRVRLFKNKKSSGSQKGPSLGRREGELFLLPSLPAGSTAVRLTQLEPETALPLQLSLHWPVFPPGLLLLGLFGVLVLAIVLALFMARRNHFPFVLPYALVLVVVYVLVRRGVSPDHPLLPVLGLGIGGGLGGSFVGYLVGKLMQRLLGRSVGPVGG